MSRSNTLQHLFPFEKENGEYKISFEQREKMKACVASLPDGKYYHVIEREFKNRSVKENSYYWGVVIAILFKEVAWWGTEEDCHEFCKQTFNGKLYRKEYSWTNPETKEVKTDHIEFVVGQSTAALKTVQFEDYLSKIRMWASIKHQIYIPLPNEARPVES